MCSPAVSGLATVVVVAAGGSVTGLAALWLATLWLAALWLAVASGCLPVALVRVTAGGRTVSGGRALFIGLRGIPLVRVTTLVGVALARRRRRLTLGRVTALVLRGVLAAGILAT